MQVLAWVRHQPFPKEPMKIQQWALGAALMTLGAGTVLATVAPDPGDLETRLEQLQEDLEAAKDAKYAKYNQAKTDQERIAALAIEPWTALDARARQLAEDAEGTEVAAQVWSLTFLNIDRNKFREDLWDSYWILIEDYTESPSLVPVVDNVQHIRFGQDRAMEGLRQLLDICESKTTLAASTLSLANMLESDEETRAEALELYRQCAKKYPEAVNFRGRKYADLANASLYEAEKLQVGMPVPNIESIDETGTKFELHDYKGKVVLLDFWAFW